ncbi:MAG: hypothetical protein O3C25_04255, partial [Chloroflexi bacterium]|nr:hypothetical protein [Chloroflexota bacterium]
PPPGPPSCSATARQAAQLVLGSQAITISLRVECDRVGSLVATPPGGDPAGAELDADGRFEGVLGRAYLCAGAAAAVVTVVTDEGGQLWRREVPLRGLVGAPDCDLLIRPGVTELDWERRSIAIADAFTDEALGAPSGFGANDSPRALDHLSVWHLDEESERWSAWGVGAPRAFRTVATLEPGERYLIASDAELAWRFPDPPLVSVLESAQIVSYYGHPDVAAMGVLGLGTPEQAADGVAELAARYDALNGDRGVIPALHLITGVAQAQPGADGRYHARMSDERVREWVELAREREQLLFLDVQIGLADPLGEVRALEEFLREPFVHLALDPEFATHGRGKPGIVIGSLDATTIDAVQAYLAELVRDEMLPPKLLVLHQFLDSMLPGSEQGYADHPEVEIVIDMDGFGPAFVKLTKYGWYALADYAERSAIKLFFLWDAPLLSPADLQSLDNPPDLVIYQ